MAEGFTFPVEAGKVREFAKAVLDDDNPIYWDTEYARSKGFKAPIVPPTFVQASSFWRPVDPAAPKRDMRRVLHGEQEFEYLHPIYVGDVLTVTTAKVSEFEKTGRRGGTMKFTVYETTYTNQDGQACVKARSTTIETGQEVQD
jgi:acyl dehydratase